MCLARRAHRMACIRQLYAVPPVCSQTACRACLGLFDVAKERARLAKQREKLAKDLAAVAARVSNQAFMSKAPPHVVAEARLFRLTVGGTGCLSSWLRCWAEFDEDVVTWLTCCSRGRQAQQDSVLVCKLTC